MAGTTISSKLQVIIPKEVRGKLHLTPRQRLVIVEVAYRRYGYRLREIAAHLGVQAVTVSRRLKQAE
ncbi:MAG: hypothetical protein JSR31_13945 [Nitrospira sp.]|nr:hypothetical protein [Nitrospira sp.]